MEGRVLDSKRRFELSCVEVNSIYQQHKDLSSRFSESSSVANVLGSKIFGQGRFAVYHAQKHIEELSRMKEHIEDMLTERRTDAALWSYISIIALSLLAIFTAPRIVEESNRRVLGFSKVPTAFDARVSLAFFIAAFMICDKVLWKNRLQKKVEDWLFYSSFIAECAGVRGK